MPKRLNFQLSEEQVTQVEQAKRKDKRAEVRQRATAVHLLHLKHEPTEVGEMLSVTEQAIYHWYHRFIRAGIDGLANQPKGRPKAKADAAYRHALEQTLASEPSEHGYDFAIWTVERLRDHLARKTDKVLSISRLREILREQKYVYRGRPLGPKHDLTSLQDGEAKAAAHAQLEELKKAQETTISTFSLWTRQR
jgi:transposase